MMKIAIKGCNWLGDAVMSIPSVKALKAAIPDTRIAVVTRPFLATLYEMVPEVDEVIVEERGISGWRRTVGAVRSGGHDVAVILPRSFASAFLLYCAGVGRRIGYGGELRNFLLTDVLERSSEILAVHRVHYYHRLLRPLGVNGTASAPTLAVDRASDDWADRALNDAGVRKGDRVIGMNPGAAYGTAKQWGVEKFADVARHCAESRDAYVVVVGSASDSGNARPVAAAAGRRGIDVSGGTTIPQLAALIRRCALFVTNDTGPMHVAAAVGTPIVALFGPTDVVTTPPYADNGTIVRKATACAPCLLRRCPIDHRCMERIGVDEVCETVDLMLGERLHGG